MVAQNGPNWKCAPRHRDPEPPSFIFLQRKKQLPPLCWHERRVGGWRGGVWAVGEVACGRVVWWHVKVLA